MDLFNKKKLKDKEREIKILNDNFERVNGELLTYKKLYKEKINNITNSQLTFENQKLIDWIEAIINKVGIKTNSCYEGKTIHIPYSEETRPHYVEGDWDIASLKRNNNT